MAHIFRFILKRSFSNATSSFIRKRNHQLLSLYSPVYSNLLLRNIGEWHIRPGDDIETIMMKLDNNAKKLGRISRSDIESAILKIQAKKCMSVSDALMLIRACGNFLPGEKAETRLKLVDRILKMAEELGVKLDISHYNALLKVYLENDHDFNPDDFLDILKTMNSNLNRLTYQRLIARYCITGDLNGSTRMLEEMRAKNMPINVDVFNCLIIGHSRADDMESAEGILNVLKDVEISPTGETMTVLIGEFLRKKNLEKAMKYLKYAKVTGVEMTDHDFLNITFAFAKEGYVEEVDEVLNFTPKIIGYSQNAINLVLRLVTIHKTEVAYKVLKTIRRPNRQDGSLLPLGDIFLVHAVKCSVPTHLIVKYCLDLMKNNLNPYSILVALEESLKCGRKETALTLLRVAKENQISIRYHYFWPLIVQSAKKKDFTEMQDILYTMNKEFDVRVNTETLREIVVPFMLDANISPDSIILQLKATGAAVAAVVSSLVLTFLRDNKLEEAANIAQKFSTYYSIYFLRIPLVNSFIATKDVDSFMKILRELGRSILWREENEENERDPDTAVERRDYREYTGQLVVLALRELITEKNNFQIIDNIFKKLIEYEVGIHPGSAVQIENILQKSMTPEIRQAIQELVSHKYEEPPAKMKSINLPCHLLDPVAMERLYESTKTEKENRVSVIKYLLTMYTVNKNLDGLSKLLNDLRAEHFIFEAGMYVKILNMYVELDMVDEALNVYNTMNNTFGKVGIDTVKLLKFILLLVRKEQTAKALEILKANGNINENYENTNKSPYIKSSLCRKILDEFIQRDDLDNLLEFRNTFFFKAFIDVNNIILGSLIKFFLKRKDLQSAIDEFERCVRKYRVTPWSVELLRHCIEKEDASNLQKILELSISVHGESAIFHNLLFCFLETGRFKDALKIMQTPTFKLSKDRFMKEAFKYYNEGEAKNLENLITLTEGIDILDHSKFYIFLLNIYDRTNDADHGLSLWTKMQEGDILPTNEFLITLAKLLGRNNQPVPFAVPESAEKTKLISQEYGKLRVSDAKSALKRYIGSGKVDKAIKTIEEHGDRSFDIYDWSMLMECCLKHDRYDDAKKLFDEYFSKYKQLPLYKVSKYICGRAMKKGDIEFYDKYKDKFDCEVKKRLSFDNHLCRTYLNANREAEYVEKLENDFEKVKSSTDYERFSAEFPRGGILSIMMERPEFAPRCEALIKKCFAFEDRNCISANILWIYYMLRKDFHQADETWRKYLQNSKTRLCFFKLNVEIQKNSDLELAMKLMDVVEQKWNIQPKTLGVIYGSSIACLVNRNKVKEALDTLDRALKRIRITDVMRSAVVTLKFACNTKNIPFPYYTDNMSYVISNDENHSDSDSEEQSFNL